MFFSSSNRLSLTLPLIIALFLPAVALADSTSQPAQVSIIKSTNIPSPPSADRMGSSGGMLSDHLLLLGGSHDGGVIINESLILPPNGTEWKHLPLQEGRAWAASAVHQNTLILAAGQGSRKFHWGRGWRKT